MGRLAVRVAVVRNSALSRRTHLQTHGDAVLQRLFDEFFFYLPDGGRTDKVTTCVSLFRLPTQNLLWLADVQVDTGLTLVASNQALR
jgi:hypothetical protein